MTNTTITNCARYGIFIYSGAKVKAENCVIAKNGNHALLVLEGGDFFFNFCHLLGYGNGEASTPAVGISNYYNDYANGVTNIGSINEGRIINSVIWGNLSSEIVFDTIPDAAITLNFDIRNSVIKREFPATENYYSGIQWNTDPLFTDIDLNDFTFPINSPLNNQGNAAFWIPTDLLGISRSSSTPDLGAFELP
jgi:hypothetical protein